MSIIYQKAVEEYINGIKKKTTRENYKSGLRRIFKSISGRKPDTDAELYRAGWRHLTQPQIEVALTRAGYKTVAPPVAVWKSLLEHLRQRGLVTKFEIDACTDDKRLGSGALWSTQPIPVDSLLPQRPHHRTLRHLQTRTRRPQEASRNVEAIHLVDPKTVKVTCH